MCGAAPAPRGHGCARAANSVSSAASAPGSGAGPCAVEMHSAVATDGSIEDHVAALFDGQERCAQHAFFLRLAGWLVSYCR